ncbi:beta-1,4-galactosyltransferase galt-1-like [Montipora capricornis]|uniref:beta-1,4-galactosyltransferase galt-1-like n=1 Tax=Montipora capricornis TaxID=246305 RepID=UPI0035F1AA53
MHRMIRKVSHYRRRWCLLVFTVASTVFILSLHFELDAVQGIQSQAGIAVLQESSRQGDASSMIIKPTDEEKRSLPSSLINKVHAGGGKHRQLRCAEPQPVKSRFRQLSKGILVFSVWYDNRKPERFIRILLLLSRKNPLPLLTCKFQSASKQTILASETVFYEHNENHHQRYGGFIVSCVVPQELERIPCSINVSITSASKTQNVKNNSLAFPVGLTDRPRSPNSWKYGICIPPVHGDISMDKIVEFIELTKILGASHFTFYDLAMTERVRNVLSHYEKKGLVSVLEWNLPVYIGNNLHYHGQVLSIMDCLYRSMRDLRFVAFHDLDEFIVPLRHDNMNSLLQEIHKDQHCGHCFESVVFDPSTNHESTKISPLITQRIFYRTSQVIRYWTKCVVDPHRIFEQGIHHISKALEEYYDADKVDWNIARVFHYRQCQDSRAEMQLTCSNSFEVDKTMRKFGDQLMLNFQIALNDSDAKRKF